MTDLIRRSPERDSIGPVWERHQPTSGSRSLSGPAISADIYTDWGIDQLAETLRGMLEESER